MTPTLSQYLIYRADMPIGIQDALDESDARCEVAVELRRVGHMISMNDLRAEEL